jgi:hypothetical protein
MSSALLATTWCKDAPCCWIADVPLSLQVDRQENVCETEDVAFQSMRALMETLIRAVEPVVGTRTPVVLNRWSCATGVWSAARDREFLNHDRTHEPSVATSP